MNETVPIGMLSTGQLANIIFFLPNDVLEAPPTPLNDTILTEVDNGLSVLSWPFKEEPTDYEVKRQLHAFTKVLMTHQIDYISDIWGLFLYNLPDNPERSTFWSEIWRLPSDTIERGINGHLTQTTLLQQDVKRHTKYLSI